MSKRVKTILFVCATIVISYVAYRLIKTVNPNPKFEIGQALDSLNGVKVYFNGGVSHTGKRNLSADGYNIGLTYQCVEFVKRYYYEFYKHKMPDSYGNAKDFFDPSVKDGAINKQRDLLQFTNPGKYKPAIGDLMIFDGHVGNPYGHVAIVSNVTPQTVEIIQQNPGPFADSRVNFVMDSANGSFSIKSERLLGWLRMKK